MGSSSGQSEYHRYGRPTMPVFQELISASLGPGKASRSAMEIVHRNAGALRSIIGQPWKIRIFEIFSREISHAFSNDTCSFSHNLGQHLASQVCEALVLASCIP